MLVVKRPFKNLGTTYTAGTVITEPAAIKRLKGKIAEGKVIVVTEQNYEATTKYFKDKYGVALPSLNGVSKPNVKAAESKPKAVKTKTADSNASVKKVSVVPSK